MAVRLTDAEWEEALTYADQRRLTLRWAEVLANGSCPEWVLGRLEGNQAANVVRLERQLELYRSVATFPHVVLKGVAHWPDFTPDPSLRMQYDLDLYCPRESVETARARAIELGFEPFEQPGELPTDHLPTMIRKTGWQWKGDYFDTEIPTSLEIHYRFWDRGTERFGPGGALPFFERREKRCWRGTEFWSLSRADSLAYACLHALRHLLRGDSQPAHLYEVGWFLEKERDPGFWSGWRRLHSDSLRGMQVLCFDLAGRWFGGRFPEAAREDLEKLPVAARTWVDRWWRAPLQAPFHPNKHELWLHLALLESNADKAVVMRRRLLPMTLPGPVDAVHLPEEQLTAARRLRRQWRYARHLWGRCRHHARILLPELLTGVRWWFAQWGLASGYWRFFAAGALFNLPLMVFFLLYNLHLAGAGFQEDFLGRIVSAMTAGSIAGSLLGGIVASRIGLRPTLIFSFLASAIVLAIRVVVLTPTGLLTGGFVSGVCISLYQVCMSPAVAALTTERNRPFAFSLTIASSVALGVVAGLIGGRLPVLLDSTRDALLLVCAVAPLAILPLLGLRLPQPAPGPRRGLRVPPVVVRFLAVASVWGLATGAFNPFFNVFFARVLGLGTPQIGVIFSVAQLAQVGAVLLAPLVLRRFGLAGGIALMQAATAGALAALGFAPAALAGWLYAAYTSFQYMSEPGLFTLLMTRVAPEERNAASSMNLMVLFGSQALAASVAGSAITATGYPPVLFSAAALALVAAILFRYLLRDPSAESRGSGSGQG